MLAVYQAPARRRRWMHPAPARAPIAPRARPSAALSGWPEQCSWPYKRASPAFSRCRRPCCPGWRASFLPAHAIEPGCILKRGHKLHLQAILVRSTGRL